MSHIKSSSPQRAFQFAFLILAANLIGLECDPSFGQSNDWPQFRGKNGESTAAVELPTQWDPARNFKWRTSLPGRGWSSPVHADGLAWMTSAKTRAATPEEIKKKLAGVQFAQIKTAAAMVEFHALCVDLESGELVHDIVLGKSNDPKPINPMNSYASPTPVLADGKVVCHFGEYGTWCLDAKSGKQLWNIAYTIDHSVGPGSSPVVVDSKVILVCDGCDQQFVAAVDLETGKELWKTKRPPIKATSGEFRKSYCTPIIREIGGKQQVVVTGAQWICGYELGSGKENWRLDYGRGYSISGMPLMIDDLVVFVTGYDFHQFVAFKPSGNNGSGALSESSIEWRKRGAPSMSSAVVNDGLIYSVGDRGVVSITNPKDGNVIAKKRVLANVSASPLLADGKLYFGNRDGKMVVLSCDEELEVLFEFDFQSPVYASACPVGKDLLIRTEKELVRISKAD